MDPQEIRRRNGWENDRAKRLRRLGTEMTSKLSMEDPRMEAEDPMIALLRRTEKIQTEMKSQGGDLAEIRRNELNVIAQMHNRLQKMETEIVRIKLEKNSKSEPVDSETQASLLEHLNRLESGKESMSSSISGIERKLFEMNEQLQSVALRTASGVNQAHSNMAKLQETAKMNSSSSEKRSAMVEQDLMTVQNKTSQLNNQVRDLMAAMETIRQDSISREKDVEKKAKQTLERLNYLNSVLEKKEEQLSERITNVQESLFTVDGTTREDGERRVRMLERQNEFSKLATDHRVGITENALGRERRDRIAAESQLRREIEIKWESFESSLREHETILKSSNERFTVETRRFLDDQLSRLDSLEEKMGKKFASISATVQESKKLLGGVSENAKLAVGEVTKKLEDLLRAEIKVRSSAIKKLHQQVENQESILNKEITSAAARDAAQFDLLTSKVGLLSSQVIELERDLRNALAREADQLKQSQNALRAQSEDQHNNLTGKIETIEVGLCTELNKSNELHQLHHEQVLSRMQGLETDLRASIENTESSLRGEVLRQGQSLDGKLSYERTQRISSVECTKRELEGKLTQMDRSFQTQLDCTQESFRELKDNLGKDLAKFSSETKEDLNTIEKRFETKMDEMNFAFHRALESQEKRQADKVQWLESENSQLKARLSSFKEESQIGLDAAKRTLLKRCDTIEEGAVRQNARINNVEVLIHLEKEQTQVREGALEEKFRNQVHILDQTMSTNLGELRQAWDSSLSKSQAHLKAYVDNRISVVRSLFHTSVQAEAATRAENIRWTRNDLERLIQVQEQLQQRFTVEKFKVLYGKMEKLLDDERSLRKEGDGTVRFALRQEIGEVQGLLREEAELRGVMESIFAAIESQHQADQQKQLRDEHQAQFLEEQTRRVRDITTIKATVDNFKEISREEMSNLENRTKTRIDDVEQSVKVRMSSLEAQTDLSINDLTVSHTVNTLATGAAQRELERQLEVRLLDTSLRLDQKSKELEKKLDLQVGSASNALLDKVNLMAKQNKQQFEEVHSKQNEIEANFEAYRSMEHLTASLVADSYAKEMTRLNSELLALQVHLKEVNLNSHQLSALKKDVDGIAALVAAASTQHSELVNKVNGISEDVAGISTEAAKLNDSLPTPDVIEGLKVDIEEHRKIIDSMVSSVKDVEELVLLIGENDLNGTKDIARVRQSIVKIKKAGNKLQDDLVFFANQGLEEKRDQRLMQDELEKLEESQEELLERGGKLEEDVLFFAGQNLEEKKRQIELENELKRVESEAKDGQTKLEEDVLFFAEQNLKEKEKQIELEKELKRVESESKDGQNKLEEDVLFFAGQNLKEKERQIELEKELKRVESESKDGQTKLEEDVLFFAGQNLKEKEKQIELEKELKRVESESKDGQNKLEEDVLFFAGQNLKEKEKQIELEKDLKRVELESKDGQSKLEEDVLFFAGQNLKEKERQIELEKNFKSDSDPKHSN